MSNWQCKIQIKQFLSDDEDYETCKEFVQNVYNVIKDDHHFITCNLSKWKEFPDENKFELIEPVDYVNKMIDNLYNFCDDNRIWVE